MQELIVQIEGLLPKEIFVKVQDRLLISEDIDSEVDKAASNFGYYAVLAEKAETRHKRLKFAMETWRSEIESRVDLERFKNGEKKFTVAQMQSHIAVQEKYKAYSLRLIALDDAARTLKILAKAFEKKADMIQTKSSNRRTEIKK